jgi:hypothetical protein
MFTQKDLENFKGKYPRIEPLGIGYAKVTRTTENPTYQDGTRTDLRSIDPKLRLTVDDKILDLYEDIVVYAAAHGLDPLLISMRVTNAHARNGRGRFNRAAAKLALMRIVSEAKTPEDRMWHAAAELEAR